MKKTAVTIYFMSLVIISFGQANYTKILVDSLKFIKADTLDCTTDLYWKIIAQKDKAIPLLIDNLNDTTPTNISFHCKKVKLNVAEVSYFALQQIASFPAFAITHLQFDLVENNCWNFFNYFFDNSNKKEYKKMVLEWYSKNKSKFKEEKIPQKTLTDCHRKYKIDTYFEWRD